jgi:hypothetical protein
MVITEDTLKIVDGASGETIIPHSNLMALFCTVQELRWRTDPMVRVRSQRSVSTRTERQAVDDAPE